MTTVTPGGNVPTLDWLRDTFVFLLQMIEQILAVGNFQSDRNNDCDNADAAVERPLGSGAPLPGGFAGTEPPEVQTFSADNRSPRSSCSSPTRRGARAPKRHPNEAVHDKTCRYQRGKSLRPLRARSDSAVKQIDTAYAGISTRLRKR